MDTLLQKYDYTVAEWPLMSSVWPITSIAAFYLIFVKIIGPNFMLDKKPMELKKTMMVYNFIQVFISAYIAYWSLDGVYVLLSMESGYKYFLKETNYLRNYAWLYLAAKITELLDTLFMVLRKKDNQISFLHLYHHTSIMFATWFYMKYFPGDHNYVVIFLNSMVHIPMYAYYFLSSFGPKVQKYLIWKRYITVIQLVQFVIGTMYWLMAAFRTEQFRVVALLPSIYGISFFVLFMNFYKKSYTKKEKTLQNSN